MNDWGFALYILFIWTCLFISFIVFIIKLIIAKKHNKSTHIIIISLLMNIIISICLFLFCSSHSTYYRYNDWLILNSNINSVYKKYGEFDRGSIQEGKSGEVAYYIYTDDGPIMPDHMPYYYWIYYDENGVVYKVEVQTLPGG